jgi:hypothetical protein
MWPTRCQQPFACDVQERRMCGTCAFERVCLAFCHERSVENLNATAVENSGRTEILRVCRTPLPRFHICTGHSTSLHFSRLTRRMESSKAERSSSRPSVATALYKSQKQLPRSPWGCVTSECVNRLPRQNKARATASTGRKWKSNMRLKFSDS